MLAAVLSCMLLPTAAALALSRAARSPLHIARPQRRLYAVRAPAPRLLLELNRVTPFNAWTAPKPELLREGDTRIDFLMENIHLTKRRVSGGIVVEAPPEAIWQCLTAYEQLPEIVPNILSNVVTRRPDGSVSIEQEQLLSRRMNLQTRMTLDVIAAQSQRELVLRRSSGHGFLEFEGKYQLRPRPDGSTYLSYAVELVPCPIFPLPLVERKIRKEVPKMLLSVRDAARRRAIT